MSDRNPEYVSNRVLLCNASVYDIKDKYEAECLSEYRDLVNKVCDAHEEISNIQKLIKEQTKQAKIEELKSSIKAIENQIVKYNVKLSQMESEYPLRYVIQRIRETTPPEQPIQETRQEKNKTKKFFEKYSYIGCFLPFIIGALFLVVMMFIKLWKFSNGSTGLFILNLILIPLAFVGGINVFRGFFAVVEMDEEKFGYKIKTDSWKFYVYMAITYGGYFALLYMMLKYA